MAWKEWVTGTNTEILEGSDLNDNFDYLSSMLAKGIISDYIADDAVTSPALAADAVVEGVVDYGTSDGVGVCQIGKDRTTHGQMIIKGDESVDTTTLTYKEITVYFTNGDVCTAGDPGFSGVPVAYATIYTNDEDMFCQVQACGTDSMLVRVDRGGRGETALAMETAQTMYWEAYGNI